MQIKIIEQQPKKVLLRFGRRFASVVVVDDEQSALDDIGRSSTKIEKKLSKLFGDL